MGQHRRANRALVSPARPMRLLCHARHDMIHLSNKPDESVPKCVVPTQAHVVPCWLTHLATTNSFQGQTNEFTTHSVRIWTHPQRRERYERTCKMFQIKLMCWLGILRGDVHLRNGTVYICLVWPTQRVLEEEMNKCCNDSGPFAFSVYQMVQLVTSCSPVEYTIFVSYLYDVLCNIM